MMKHLLAKRPAILDRTLLSICAIALLAAIGSCSKETADTGLRIGNIPETSEYIVTSNVLKLTGTGFQEHDIIRMTNLADSSSYYSEVNLVDGGVEIYMKGDFSSGLYDIYVLRGSQEVLYGTVTLTNALAEWPDGWDSWKIPIVGWYSIPAADATLERYEEFRDAGLNISYSHLTTFEQAQTALDLAQQAGVKVLFGYSNFNAETATEAAAKATIDKVKDHPALAGYALIDEPSASLFPAVAAWVNRIRAADDEHFCYVNMLPIYAKTSDLGTSSYREYVQQYVQEVPTQILSFDHYPIVKGVLRDGFFENLEIVSEEARNAGKPFWAFALATAHYNYRVPTMSDLRLQMYSNLAYGAAGLQYFTYWTPLDDGIYYDGPITLDKVKGEAWYRVQAMNEELQNRARVFNGTTVRSVRHTGETLPDGTSQLVSLPDEVDAVDTGGDGALVSFLENDESLFMMIVNTSLDDAIQVSVTFAKEAKQIYKDGSESGVALSVSEAVEAGDALIYTWKK